MTLPIPTPPFGLTVDIRTLSRLRQWVELDPLNGAPSNGGVAVEDDDELPSPETTKPAV